MDDLQKDQAAGAYGDASKTGAPMTRRTFVSGLSIAGIAAATVGLSACSGATSSRKDDSSDGALPTEPETVDETIDADLVIVGAGVSGLVCAIQAKLDGANVVLLEKGSEVGGSGAGVEGIFGVNTPFQEELGIEIDPMQIIVHEQQSAQYRVDGSLWKDLIDQSADNIAWCLEQGVLLSGQVDNYYTGVVNTMHWFEGGHGGVGYVPPMKARIAELGIDTRTSTPATSLIKNEEGKIVGCYARSADGKDIKINASAVVLATGGIGNNVELLKKQGWGPRAERMYMAGVPQITGDGYQMAMQVSAGDFLAQSCQLVTNYVEAFGVDTEPPYDAPLTHIGGGGPVLWVNQDGRRFVNENASGDNLFLQSVAIKDMREAYMVFDTDFLSAFYDETPGAQEAFERDFPENKGESVFKADTLEGLAATVSIDPERLIDTVDRYNEMCRNGADLDFGKEAGDLVELKTPPYYIARLDSVNYCTIGAITTNMDWQVLDTDRKPIPGLYAVGNDGIMMYRNIYTVDVPCSCCGSCVNSGREAAKNALAV